MQGKTGGGGMAGSDTPASAWASTSAAPSPTWWCPLPKALHPLQGALHARRSRRRRARRARRRGARARPRPGAAAARLRPPRRRIDHRHQHPARAQGRAVGMITTAGFRDSLEIRRGGCARDLWNHRAPFPAPLVPRSCAGAVAERHRRHRHRLRAAGPGVGAQALAVLRDEGVEAIAICLLTAFRNPAHEQAVARLIERRSPDVWMSCSSEVAPMMGEYERGSTTVVNAYVAPRAGALPAGARTSGWRARAAAAAADGAEQWRRADVRRRSRAAGADGAVRPGRRGRRDPLLRRRHRLAQSDRDRGRRHQLRRHPDAATASSG